MSNKYHDQLIAIAAGEDDPEVAALKFSAGGLLDIMRPEVEAILLEYQPEPSCPSQSYRAIQVVRIIEQKIENANGSTGRLTLAEFGSLRPHRQSMETLQDFLAVHRTVWILEGRAL